MAHVQRQVLQWLRWHKCHCRATPQLLFDSTSSFLANKTSPRPASFAVVPFPHRKVHFRSRSLRLPNTPASSDLQESNGDELDRGAKKSRNEKKREARRAVRWGMELAAFSTLQIKRIIRAASLEPEVLEAIRLVKRLGRDVREGKRRQFNYIGRLLREVEPELMDGLIQATKDGDQSKFQGLSGSEAWFIEEGDEDEEETDTEDEEEGYLQDSNNYANIAGRWFDGLINKDFDITKEVYSVQEVDFDRQELRRLLRDVHSMKERQASSQEDAEGINAALLRAERSLTRFLLSVARQLTRL
ncbi:hypothetical protein NMG60_11024452 [Bertholletia excelsa]